MPVSDDIERLGQLREQGYLTEDEFQQQKRRVLNGGGGGAQGDWRSIGEIPLYQRSLPLMLTLFGMPALGAALGWAPIFAFAAAPLFIFLFFKVYKRRGEGVQKVSVGAKAFMWASSLIWLLFLSVTLTPDFRQGVAHGRARAEAEVQRSSPNE